MNTHIYPETGQGSARWIQYLNDVIATMRTMGAPSRLWITETTYNLLGPVLDDATSTQLVRLRVRG
jgi:hypothetical protein